MQRWGEAVGDGRQRLPERELAAIEARATAATEGPWRIGDLFMPTDADWLFMAASRTDVPALLAEVRRLRALLPEGA